MLPVTASGEYILKGASTIIAFACSVDSPCIDIVPTFPETPAYYIQFEMVTAGVSKGDTYCDYSTRFLFRVYGMPTSSHVMLNVFLVVLSIGAALIVAITVYVRWRVQCLEKLLEATLQGQGFNAEIALLNPESYEVGGDDVTLCARLPPFHSRLS